METRRKWFFGAIVATIAFGAAMSEYQKSMARASSSMTKPTGPPYQVFADMCVRYAKAGLHDPDSADVPNALSAFDYPGKFNIVDEKNSITIQFEMRAKNGFNALRLFVADCSWKKMKSDYGPMKFRSWQR
jgi:hypothetical protein